MATRRNIGEGESFAQEKTATVDLPVELLEIPRALRKGRVDQLPIALFSGGILIEAPKHAAVKLC